MNSILRNILIGICILLIIVGITIGIIYGVKESYTPNINEYLGVDLNKEFYFMFMTGRSLNCAATVPHSNKTIFAAPCRQESDGDGCYAGSSSDDMWE